MTRKDRVAGVDLGVTTFVAPSTSESAPGLTRHEVLMERPRRLVRRLARKRKGGRNRVKGQRRLAGLPARMKDAHQDATRTSTSRFIHEFDASVSPPDRSRTCNTCGTRYEGWAARSAVPTGEGEGADVDTTLSVKPPKQEASNVPTRGWPRPSPMEPSVQPRGADAGDGKVLPRIVQHRCVASRYIGSIRARAA